MLWTPTPTAPFRLLAGGASSFTSCPQQWGNGFCFAIPGEGTFLQLSAEALLAAQANNLTGRSRPESTASHCPRGNITASSKAVLPELRDVFAPVLSHTDRVKSRKRLQNMALKPWGPSASPQVQAKPRSPDTPGVGLGSLTCAARGSLVDGSDTESEDAGQLSRLAQEFDTETKLIPSLEERIEANRKQAKSIAQDARGSGTSDGNLQPNESPYSRGASDCMLPNDSLTLAANSSVPSRTVAPRRVTFSAGPPEVFEVQGNPPSDPAMRTAHVLCDEAPHLPQRHSAEQQQVQHMQQEEEEEDEDEDEEDDEEEEQDSETQAVETGTIVREQCCWMEEEDEDEEEEEDGEQDEQQRQMQDVEIGTIVSELQMAHEVEEDAVGRSQCTNRSLFQV